MNFNVGNIQRSSPHLFSDLAELITLVDYTGRQDLHMSDLSAICAPAPTDLDEVDDETLSIASESCDAEVSDRVSRQLEDVWSHLEFRQATMGDNYPFLIEGDTIKLKTGLTDLQRIYVMLLACSRLRSFPQKGGVRQLWAGYFTKLSKYALASLLPAHAVVRIFDANSDDRREYYSTDLREALVKLGQDLGVASINHAECAKVHPSGDGGFDIIATVDFEDSLSSNFAILGQCGAQETEWPKKTLEAHSIKLRTYFQTHFDYQAAMLTPVLYRDSQGSWVDTSACAGVLLLDRLRILRLLGKHPNCPDITRSDWFLQFEQMFQSVKME